jgi:NADH-quinone oxidoreductase subunit C
MSVTELQQRVDAGLAEAGVPATTTVTFGELTIDVEPIDWIRALEAARDRLGLTFFDWLSAVDELDQGIDVVVHLAEPGSSARALVRTRVAPDQTSLPSATTVFRGSAWHERETFEMFGLEFAGHPHLVPLLLPDGFEGHPLRKSFVLASRATKSWPGSKEPGESDHDGAPSRRKMQPPGVPDPETWGPRPQVPDEPSAGEPE